MRACAHMQPSGYILLGLRVRRLGGSACATLAGHGSCIARDHGAGGEQTRHQPPERLDPPYSQMPLAAACRKAHNASSVWPLTISRRGTTGTWWWARKASRHAQRCTVSDAAPHCATSSCGAFELALGPATTRALRCSCARVSTTCGAC